MALNIRKIAAQRAVHYKIHIKKANFHQIINRRNQLFFRCLQLNVPAYSFELFNFLL